jgi:hypothetical protein
MDILLRDVKKPVMLGFFDDRNTLVQQPSIPPIDRSSKQAYSAFEIM